MSELAPLISDLALILICAGVMTLVFKRLKQPLVLGYIVAGFLASPHVPLTPSVIDVANIHTWSEIGVIFLLFALGLEFSFKKLVKVGGGGGHCGVYHYILYDIGWNFCGVVFRVATHGLSVFGRYVGHVLHDYYL